jgi:hypothetical protein
MKSEKRKVNDLIFHFSFFTILQAQKICKKPIRARNTDGKLAKESVRAVNVFSFADVGDD